MIRVFIKIILIIACCIIFFPINLFARILNIQLLGRKNAKYFCKTMLLILGVKVKLHGHIPKGTVFYISNHISYIDILGLGAFLEASFTPKKELSTWFFVNLMIFLSYSIYIERNPKKVKSQIHTILKHLKKARSIIIFPESTTGNGKEILPFKSSLFETIFHCKKNIYPITIKYHTKNIAWYGDMTIIPHALQVLAMKKIIMHIYIDNPIDTKNLSRKDMRDISYNIIKNRFSTI